MASGSGPYASRVAQVDPDDDSIRRIVLYRYQFDPTRRQRRNVVVAAFDDEGEFRDFMDEQKELLDEQKAQGMAEDLEYLHGTFKEPGHARRIKQRRMGMGEFSGWVSCSCEPGEVCECRHVTQFPEA